MEHRTFDVLVVGGGHAGVEAAAAAARMGATVALVTHDAATIGAMSCNPSIGGVGKGHIVREIDALDGVMAVAADAAAIHHRMLNASKGAAVRGPRVQADRSRYAAAVRGAIEDVTIVTGDVIDLAMAGDRVAGVRLFEGATVRARTVVLATGTFLAARMFRGRDRMTGGRIGERAATALAHRLRDAGLVTGRLKTGTPPRLDGGTIDWARLSPQPSDDATWTMATVTPGRQLPQLACAITRTDLRTHDAIRAAMGDSPLRDGTIAGDGPRYCPSIEDKVARFGDRDGHQIFLEPEGLDTAVVYPNGISTSLSTEAQMTFVASVAGLERARIVVPGYAVEYDYIDPRSLTHQLACRTIGGLYRAGQINGTTGYEEAAGQGLVAGLHAAAEALGRPPVAIDRASSYLGVMIDDLVLQGVTEPYRMLTARAEYRLSLRADNAEQRLTAVGEAAGCLTEPRRRHAARRADLRARVAGSWPDDACAGTTMPNVPDDIVEEVAADRLYRPYLERQAREVAQFRDGEATAMPAAIDYRAVPGLSNEMIERLSAVRPPSLGAAARIRGITPAALSAILLQVRRLAA